MAHKNKGSQDSNNRISCEPFLSNTNSLFKQYSSLYFIHPLQLPAIKLHDDFMQLCALAKNLHSWSLGIAIDLSLGILPLFLYPCLIMLFVFALISFRNKLQLYDVAMLRWIVCEVGQKEEVAIAMVQLQFWRSIIVRI